MYIRNNSNLVLKNYVVLIFLFSVTYILPSFDVKFAVLTAFYSIFSFYILVRSKVTKKDLSVFFFIAILTVCSVFINNNATSLPHLVYFLSYIIFMLIVSRALIENFTLGYDLVKFNLWFAVFFITIGLVFVGLTEPVPVRYYGEFLFYGQSRNIVSYYLIVSMIGYILFSSLTGHKLDKKIIYISFSLCVILYGRSGILLSGAILALTINTFKLRYKTLALILFGSILFYNYELIISILNESSFQKGLESPRAIITSQFLAVLDLDSLLTGVKISSVPQAEAYDGNPHNSYIYANFKFGYMMLFFMVMSFWMILNTIYTRNWILLSLISILIIRYNLDVVAFFGQYTDLVFFIMFLISFDKTKLTIR